MQDPYAAAVFRAPTDRTTKAYVKNSFPHGRGYALSSFRHQRSVVVSAPVQDTAGSPQSSFIQFPQAGQVLPLKLSYLGQC